MAESISGLSPYCTPLQALLFTDERKVGDLLGRGFRLDRPTILASADFLSILRSASGELESSILLGKRYQVEDLLKIVALPTSNGAQLLARVVAGLAYGILFENRGFTKEGAGVEIVKWAREYRDALRKGEMILPLDANVEAGVPRTSFRTERELERERLATILSERMYGIRSNRGRQSH